MAFFAKLSSSIFLLALFSLLLQIHAREGVFFAKHVPQSTITNTNTNSNLEDSTEPTFHQLESQQYGLPQDSSPQFHPSSTVTSTTTTPHKYEANAYNSETTPTAFSANPKKYENSYYPQQKNEANAFYSESTATNNNNNYNNRNFYDNQAMYKPTTTTTTAAFSHNYNNYNNPYEQQYGAKYNSYNNNNNNNNQYERQQHGMSDTRYLENGKFFYDVKQENANGYGTMEYNSKGAFPANQYNANYQTQFDEDVTEP